MTWDFSQLGGSIGPLNGNILTALIGAAMPFMAAVLAVTGIGISLIGAGSALLLDRTTLFSVAGVGLGVSLISAGVACLLLSGAQIVGAVIGLGVWLISAGITAIGIGSAFLFGRGILTAACVGFGVSLIGAGLTCQFWGWTALAACLIALGVVITGVAFLFAQGIFTATARVGFGISIIGAAVATFLIHDTLAWIEPLAINNGVVAVLDMGVVTGTWTAIGVAVAALVGGVVLPLARGTLVGFFGICLGVSLIGAGIAAVLVGAALFAIWLVGAGVSLIPLAVARLRDQSLLGAVAAVGFGVSLAVLGVSLLLTGEPLGGVAVTGASLATVTAGVAIYPQADLRNWLSRQKAAWTQSPARNVKP